MCFFIFSYKLTNEEVQKGMTGGSVSLARPIWQTLQEV